MIAACNLADLKAIGNRFSWSGKRCTHDVKCCLDRAMANSEWLALFPSAQVEFLAFEASKHRPLLIKNSQECADRQSFFCYDKRLFDKEGFQNTNVQSCMRQQPSTPPHNRLYDCRVSMSK